MEICDLFFAMWISDTFPELIFQCTRRKFTICHDSGILYRTTVYPTGHKCMWIVQQRSSQTFLHGRGCDDSEFRHRMIFISMFLSRTSKFTGCRLHIEAAFELSLSERPEIRTAKYSSIHFGTEIHTNNRSAEQRNAIWYREVSKKITKTASTWIRSEIRSPTEINGFSIRNEPNWEKMRWKGFWCSDPHWTKVQSMTGTGWSQAARAWTS